MAPATVVKPMNHNKNKQFGKLGEVGITNHIICYDCFGV